MLLNFKHICGFDEVVLWGGMLIIILQLPTLPLCTSCTCCVTIVSRLTGMRNGGDSHCRTSLRWVLQS